MRSTLNKILIRILLLTLVVFSGIIVEASDFLGLTGLAITGDLNVTGNLTLNNTEGAIPRNTFILWDGATCPAGWVAVSTYDNRFPIGGASLATGGSDTHTHTSTHTHSIANGGYSSWVGHAHYVDYSFGYSGDHTHTTSGCGATPQLSFPSGTSYHLAGTNVQADGDHTHSPGSYVLSSTADEHDHTISGTISASGTTSSSATSVPIYRTLKICSKW